MMFQQLLTVITEHPAGSIDETATAQVRELLDAVRKNKSERINSELVHTLVPTDPELPLICSEEKTKTKWERFAEEKGIKKRRRPTQVYSEEYKAWLPRWGARSPQNLAIRGGVLEGASATKLRKEKAERIAKNKKNKAANKQRLAFS